MEVYLILNIFPLQIPLKNCFKVKGKKKAEIINVKLRKEMHRHVTDVVVLEAAGARAGQSQTWPTSELRCPLAASRAGDDEGARGGPERVS